jgi:ABC-2 type transport system ATP-binding protein
MIKISHFCKRYGKSDVYAGYDINLEVHQGEVLGLLGPNGGGKSTLIKSIVGIQSISDGKIEICGHDIEKDQIEAKLLIGFVPDHYALFEGLTGKEYIDYIAAIYNVSNEDKTQRVEELVKRFKLEEAFTSQIKTYSHGMKQKITIIGALVHDPKVWILDEPLTGLDPDSIFEVKEALKEHAKKGNIVLFSSHLMDVAERLCTRIAVIKFGHIIADTTIEEILKSDQTLENYYLRLIAKTDVEATVCKKARPIKKGATKQADQPNI